MSQHFHYRLPVAVKKVNEHCKGHSCRNELRCNLKQSQSKHCLYRCIHFFEHVLVSRTQKEMRDDKQKALQKTNPYRNNPRATENFISNWCEYSKLGNQTDYTLMPNNSRLRQLKPHWNYWFLAEVMYLALSLFEQLTLECFWSNTVYMT